MSMPKKYSEKEKQEIISAYQHRQPLADIGGKFGVALSTIYRWGNDKKECITEENMLPMDIRNLLSLKERLEHILQIIRLSNLLAEVPPRRRLDIYAGEALDGALCCYFREAVLPNDPVLEASLAAEGPAPKTQPCPVCGRAFLPDGRTRYCSPGCAKAARLKKQRGYMRKYRG